MTTKPTSGRVFARGTSAKPSSEVPDDASCRRGEFVYGLGWSCVTHDTFGCPGVQPSAKPGSRASDV